MNSIHGRSFTPLLLFILLIVVTPSGLLPAQGADHRSLFARAKEALDAGKYDEAWKLFKEARELDRANANYKRWLMYVSVFQGQSAIFDNNHDTALIYFNTALAVKKDLNPDPKATDGELYNIQRYIDLIKEHALYSKTTPQYVHRVQALYIMKTDLKDVVDGSGKPVISKGEIAESLIEGSSRYQKMLKFYIETLTRGRVTLSFDRKIVNTTLTRATIHAEGKSGTKFRPDFNSTTESLGPIMFEGRNKYDTTIFYFNNDNFDVMIYAMGVPTIYIPYTWYGPPRGSVGLMLGGKTLPKNPTFTTNFPHIWIIFHEFFHVIERMSGGIRPQHAYLAETIGTAKKNFPDWVPDMNPVWTATEYSWYRYHLINTVPARMEKRAAETGLHPPFLNFSFRMTEPDRTEEYVYDTYTAAVRGISPDNLRRASELLEEACRLRREKKSEEAVEKLRMALRHNPCSHQVLLELGREALERKDAAEADRHFSAMAKVFPDPKELFSIGKSFFDRGDFTLAAKYFRITAERPGRNPVYACWQARALAASGDTDGARSALAPVADNPAMKAPAAYITNKGAGQALYSTANPEIKSAAGLAAPRRQEGCRWKLVPAGEKDYVMIVSDYTWKCLEARGADGQYAVFQGEPDNSDSKKWRLAGGSGGLYRIISKASGTPLAVTTDEEGKKAFLTLQKVDSNLYWEIQELDIALNGMDFERNVIISSAFNSMAVDLYAGKAEDGAAIKLWPRNGNANQQWKVIPSGDPGFVYIVAVRTWKCLSAVEDNGRIGTVQTSIAGDSAQKWRVVSRKDGRSLIINKKFNRALEVDPSNQSSKTLHLGDNGEGENQLWKIE